MNCRTTRSSVARWTAAVLNVSEGPAERSFASPWVFAVAVELMLTNAQIYNDEDSQIHGKPASSARAFVKAMEERFHNSLCRGRSRSMRRSMSQCGCGRGAGRRRSRRMSRTRLIRLNRSIGSRRQRTRTRRALARAMKAGAAIAEVRRWCHLTRAGPGGRGRRIPGVCANVPTTIPRADTVSAPPRVVTSANKRTSTSDPPRPPPRTKHDEAAGALL